MPTRNLTIIVISAIVSMVCYTATPHNRDAAVIADAINKIESEYVYKVPRRKLFQSAMKGLVNGLDDPHSSYLPPLRNQQIGEELAQEFGGVGILIRGVAGQDGDRKYMRIFILNVHPDSPAKEAGIKPGDEILEIDGHPVKEMNDQRQQASDLIRGKVGTPVVLKLRRYGEKEPLEKSILRGRITVSSLFGDRQHADWTWDYYLQEHPNIGYLRLTQFGKHSADELRNALKFEGKKIDAVMLDLRGNGGGLLPAAVDVCDLFIDEGKIVTTKGRGGVIEDEYVAKSSTTAIDTSVPMVVLIDGNSASASEITAACLQDNGRAVVVGHRSFGKGSVQNIIDLEAGRGAIKLTTATYWRPSGKNIHRKKNDKEDDVWGVLPNQGFRVDLTDEEMAEVYRLRNLRDNEVALQEMAPEIRELLMRKPSDDKLPDNFQDPQLRKAVEYLLQQIKSKEQKAKPELENKVKRA